MSSLAGDADQSGDAVAVATARAETLKAKQRVEAWDITEEDQVRSTPAPAVGTRRGCRKPIRPREHTVRNFVAVVARNYEKNPYHNWAHAWNVFATTGILLRDGWHDYADDVDIFALMVAALCHDLGHPGLTNEHFVNQGHRLARTYNNLAVLENMHAYTMYTILELPGCNLLEEFSAAEQAQFRAVATTAIMGTAMTVHFDLMKSLTQVKNARDAEELQEKPILDEKRFNHDAEVMKKIIVHAADLGNCVQPLGSYTQWAERIFMENHLQCEYEKGQKSSFESFAMEVNPGDSTKLAKFQLGFLDFIAVPFWETIVDLYPLLEDRRVAMHANVKYWRLEAAKTASSEVAEKTSPTLEVVEKTSATAPGGSTQQSTS
ncbi:unnamed protein product [Amoebophrya sp. A25]|nr:unnamed protein product [Amoebophrya sp. A25]|eukprot:GSA25T00009178001.1